MNNRSARKQSVSKSNAGITKAANPDRVGKGKVRSVEYDLRGREDLTPSTACLPSEITDHEILAYYPRHLTWPRVMLRLVENGWTQTEIARYMNFIRGFHGPDSFKVNTITKQIQKAAMVEGLGANFKRSEYTPAFATDRSTTGYKHPKKKLLDNISLAQLGKGIVHFPSREEAGPLTRSMRFAMERPERDFTVRDYDFWVRYGIVPPEIGVRDQPEADSNDESMERTDEKERIDSAENIHDVWFLRYNLHKEDATAIERLEDLIQQYLLSLED